MNTALWILIEAALIATCIACIACAVVVARQLLGIDKHSE